jgi:hypothetical protein
MLVQRKSRTDGGDGASCTPNRQFTSPRLLSHTFNCTTSARMGQHAMAAVAAGQWASCCSTRGRRGHPDKCFVMNCGCIQERVA